MHTKQSYRYLAALGVFIVVILLLGTVCLASPEEFTFANSLWALLPPVVAIGLALITKEVYSSLTVGILIGGMMYTKFDLIRVLDILVSGAEHVDPLAPEDGASVIGGLIPSISSLAGILVFLVILGAVVALINKTGASAAFGRWAKAHIKSKIGAYLATFVLGILIFIDDYFNCLTVGSVMSPVTDTHKISRVKLAYVIDATAAPICMIAPVSSWAAAVSSSVPNGFPISGIELFVRAIPFNFYSLFTLVFIVAIAIMGFDYGKMSGFEIKAKDGDLSILGDEKKSEEDAPNPRGRIYDLLIPVIVLVIVCAVALLYVGGFFGTDAWGGTDYKWDFVGAFGNTDAMIALPWGAIIAFIFTVIYLLLRQLINFKGAMDCLVHGFIAMVPAIMILILATTLKDTTALLGSNVFVQELAQSIPTTVMKFMPALIFLAACLLAFATGTSWGTFGIMIPIVANLFATQAGEAMNYDVTNPLLFVGISACLAGAVCGDHCSPISDTTIMASAGANCNHVDHVSTQLPYAITVAGISFVMYVIAGFLPYAWLCLPVGAGLTVGTLFVIRLIKKKRAASLAK